MFPPATHANDPITSHEALSKHETSGARQRHCEIVLQMVRLHPHQTANELFALLSQEWLAEIKEAQEVRRRLSDLLHRDQPIVKQGPRRRCSIKGSSMVTWSELCPSKEEAGAAATTAPAPE